MPSLYEAKRLTLAFKDSVSVKCKIIEVCEDLNNVVVIGASMLSVELAVLNTTDLGEFMDSIARKTDLRIGPQFLLADRHLVIKLVPDDYKGRDVRSTPKDHSLAKNFG